jgi:hypothetical protein
MQKRFLLLALITHVALISAFAQDEAVSPKKSNHYVGLQANQLIRQIFNFSNTNTSLNNPYLLTYAVNSVQGGGGFTMGFGYHFDEATDGDQFIERTTTNNNLFFRVGFEKKSLLAPKIIFSLGGDVVLGREKFEVVTEEKTQSQTNFESSRVAKSSGFGPRLTINYQIQEKIIIGTEANYYFVWRNIDETQTDVFFETVFDPVTGQQRTIRRTQETTDSEKDRRFQFNPPAVIFLIMKF